jgi:two-component system sensor histidine kinase KdpD
MVDARSAPAWRPGWPLQIGVTALVVAASSGAAGVLFGRDSLPDVAMLHLLGIVAVAMRFSFGASILAVILSVLSYDFFFVPPYLSLRVNDGRHLVTFVVMFLVGVVISTLTQRVRDHAGAARAREERTALLYAMTRELSSTRAPGLLAEVATRHLAALVDGSAVLSPPDPTAEGGDATPGHDGGSASELPGAILLPLVGTTGRLGVLQVVPRARERFTEPEQRQLLDTFAAQIAGALERAQVAAEAEAARLEATAERLQSSLLSSVSHDLRTPLAVITGAASTLLSASPVDGAVQRDLYAVIYEESVRLTRLVGNLLDMTRLAAGAMKVNEDWQSVEAVVGAAIGRVEDRLGGRPLATEIPADLPLVPFDAVLIEQVLINLLENAAKHAPAGSPIEVTAAAGPSEVTISVLDRGPGVPEDERGRIFDKFYRVPGARGGGAGLGLAICRGIVEAHGGRIDVGGREGGGAAFHFTLPIEGSPPAVEEDGA